MLNWDNGDISTGKLVKIYCAYIWCSIVYTDLGLYQQFKSYRIQNSRHFRLLSNFPELFKADLNSKDFSRKPSKFKYFSSLCEPWSTLWTDTTQSIHRSYFIISIMRYYSVESIWSGSKLFNSVSWEIYPPFLSSADLKKNQLFWKILSEIPPVCVKQFGSRSGPTFSKA